MRQDPAVTECHPGPWLASLLLLFGLAAPAWAEEEPAKAPPMDTTAPKSKVIQPGDWVWIDYAVWLTDGALFDTTTQRQPLRLKQGAGTLPAAVEEALIGMKVEEHTTLRLPPEQAYGARREDLLESVPLDSIPESAREVGHKLELRDVDGQLRALRVHKIEGDRAILDMNNPLAGATVTFDIRIVEIHREPEAAEPQ